MFNLGFVASRRYEHVEAMLYLGGNLWLEMVVFSWPLFINSDIGCVRIQAVYRICNLYLEGRDILYCFFGVIIVRHKFAMFQVAVTYLSIFMHNIVFILMVTLV